MTTTQVATSSLSGRALYREQVRARARAAAVAATCDCPTIARLNAIRPGEQFRYLSVVDDAVSGPAYTELISRIMDYAAGLALAGRIERKQEKRTLPDGKNKQPIRITDHIAIGKSRT